MVLILHHKCMHLINSLWCRCDLAVSSHLFPFSAVQNSHWDPSWQQQQHVHLIASHNLQHFQAPVQELILQHVLPSPHYHWFCKHEAKPSTQPHLAYRKSSPWSYSLPPADGEHSKEGRPCRCSIQILAKCCKLCSLKYNSTGLLPPNLHGYKLTEDKQKWHHPVVHLLHISLKCLRAVFPWPCMAYPPSRAFQDTTSRDGILLNTLQALSILPHLAYMSTKLFPENTLDS